MISRNEKHLDYLREQIVTAKSQELPLDILVSVLSSIKQEVKEIMKTISKVKVTLPQNYEKKANAILAAQKLLTAANQNQEARDLPQVDIEKAGEKKNSTNDTDVQDVRSLTIDQLTESSKNSENVPQSDIEYVAPITCHTPKKKVHLKKTTKERKHPKKTNPVQREFNDQMKYIRRNQPVTILEPTNKECDINVTAKNSEFIVEDGNLPPIEIERVGEQKSSANDDNETEKWKSVPKQPVHETISKLLEDEDLQPKTIRSKLPALLLANKTHGIERNLCFTNSPVQLLRHIPTFRCVIFFVF